MAHTTAPGSRVDRASRVVIPAGMAVLAWLVALLAVGMVAGLSLSVLNVLPLLLVGVLVWPIYRAAPWRPGLTERTRRFLEGNRAAILAGAGLLVVRSVPVTPGPVVGLLDLPFRSTGLLFGASVFYRSHVGAAFGRFILDFGQWYLEGLWLFGLGLLLAGLARRVK